MVYLARWKKQITSSLTDIEIHVRYSFEWEEFDE